MTQYLHRHSPIPGPSAQVAPASTKEQVCAPGEAWLSLFDLLVAEVYVYSWFSFVRLGDRGWYLISCLGEGVVLWSSTRTE